MATETAVRPEKTEAVVGNARFELGAAGTLLRNGLPVRKIGCKTVLRVYGVWVQNGVAAAEVDCPMYEGMSTGVGNPVVRAVFESLDRDPKIMSIAL